MVCAVAELPICLRLVLLLYVVTEWVGHAHCHILSDQLTLIWKAMTSACTFALFRLWPKCVLCPGYQPHQLTADLVNRAIGVVDYHQECATNRDNHIFLPQTINLMILKPKQGREKAMKAREWVTSILILCVALHSQQTKCSWVQNGNYPVVLTPEKLPEFKFWNKGNLGVGLDK